MLAAMKPDGTVALCAGVAGHPKGKDKAAQRELSDTALRQEKHGNVRLIVFETAPPLASIRSHAGARCVACFCNSIVSKSA